MHYSDRIWSASWIEYSSCPPTVSPVLSKTFQVTEFSDTPTLYICGVGFYTARINGVRVGDHLLAPAFSAYDQTVYYNVFNVAPLLKEGENTIEVTLGNGWFNQQEPDDWQFHHASWRKPPQLLCEIVCGRNVLVKSDSSWTCRQSRIVYNSLRFGETFDAAMDEPTELHSARISRGAGGYLCAQSIRPIRLQEEIAPAAVIEAADGSITYDFGVNLSGNAHICVRGRRGGKVTILYSELIFADGTPDRDAIRGSTRRVERFQQDEYILSGEGSENWHSEFGYNGFRYANVKVENAEIVSITARCFHTDLPQAGSFEADHPLINKLQSALLRATRTNFHHIPTDCPHREKNGWTGDAHLSCEQALFNFDIASAYKKWMTDLMNTQRPSGELAAIAPTCIWGYNWGNGATWDHALFEIPWQSYLFAGDRSALEQCEKAMSRYITFLESTCDNGIWKIGLGDWCAPVEIRMIPRPLIVTAYVWRTFCLYSKIMRVLGKAAEAEYAQRRCSEIRTAFQKHFIPREPDSQTYLALLLAFDLSDEPREALMQRLEKCIEEANGHMMCGIFGVRLLYDVLTDNGRFDLAWKLLTAEGYPGWSDMIERCPSTLTERWDGKDSRNHHMYSSVGAWFYTGIAGIRLDENEPGFKHIFLKPHIPDGCGFFRAAHETPMGQLIVEWKDKQLHITLPEGCRAELTWNEQAYQLSAGQHTF